MVFHLIANDRGFHAGVLYDPAEGLFNRFTDDIDADFFIAVDF